MGKYDTIMIFYVLRFSSLNLVENIATMKYRPTDIALWEWEILDF